MTRLRSLDTLRAAGRLRWDGPAHGWAARSSDVLDALSRDGFQEYRREITFNRSNQGAAGGGVWQGLDPDTGSVASAIWATRAETDDAIIFIDIDGDPVQG